MQLMFVIFLIHKLQIPVKPSANLGLWFSTLVASFYIMPPNLIQRRISDINREGNFRNLISDPSHTTD